MALGTQPTITKSVRAFLISAISRLVTTQFPKFATANGEITDPTTSNALIVMIFNGLVAYGMKDRNIARSIAIGVSADVLSDRALSMLSLDPNKSLIGSKE